MIFIGYGTWHSVGRPICPMGKFPSIISLFPYTTLFRSCHGRRDADRRTDNRPLQGVGGKPHRGGERGGVGEDRDRKSTRLNSSHTVISYAVFCLKKKIRDRSCADQRAPNWTMRRPLQSE